MAKKIDKLQRILNYARTIIYSLRTVMDIINFVKDIFS